MNTLRTNQSIPRRQHGAAMMIMLVILIIGLSTFLVSALSSSALQSERNRTTAEVLAQAKEALIGRATSDSNTPGSLPCPDINDDGISEGNCTSYIGRLPWRTLGLPDLRDSSGERLWYALSTNFRDNVSSHPLNSESNGSLNVSSGAQIQNNVIAIVFSPGNALSGQDRSSTATTSSCTIGGVSNQPNSYCLQNYLEGSNAAAPPNLNFQSTATGIQFNDQLITISRGQLFSTVEMRIAREAKICLDDYASANSNKYPWAADPTDTSFYYSKPNTLFGRLPKHQPPDVNVQNLISAINAFQTSVTNCANGVGNQAALISAGGALETAAETVQSNQPTSPLIPNTVTNPAATAGENAKDVVVSCAGIQADPTGNAIQTNLNNTLKELNNLPPSLSLPASCSTLYSSAYWTDWRNQVFYQVDPKYQPGGTLGLPSITINGAGPYRAVVVVARSPILGQIRNPSDPSTYLEGINLHYPVLTSTFTSNSVSGSNFQNINDLVACLDGNIKCK